MEFENRILGVVQINDADGVTDDYVTLLIDFVEEYADMTVVVRTKSGGVGKPLSAGRFDSYNIVWILDDDCFGPMVSTSELVQRLGEFNQDFVEIVQSHFLVINRPEIILNMWGRLTDGTLRIPELTEILYNEGNRGSIFSEFGFQYHRFPPFLDKNLLMKVDLDTSSGEIPKKILSYIKKYTEYNTDLIWKHLLRVCNIQDLKNALHLEYIIPEGNLKRVNTEISHTGTALIAHLYYEDMVDECLGYLKQVPEFIDLYITTSNSVTWEKINSETGRWSRKNCFLRWKENRGRDVSSLLVTCHDILMKYELLGFVHDKKSSHSLGENCGSNSFQYHVWENLIRNGSHVEQILQYFHENPRLGLMVPPRPYYATFLGCLADSWGSCFEITKDLADGLGLGVKVEKDKYPITLSTSFWCRTEAMRKLFIHPYRYEDFPEEPMAADGTVSHAIERILAYVAQSDRYYTAFVMSSEYASLRGNCLELLLLDVLEELEKETIILKPGDIREYHERRERILSFCRSFPHVYIYGAGTYGQKCGKLLKCLRQSFTGYLVSDGHKVRQEVDGMPVYQLSELLERTEDCGVILALNAGNQKEVNRLLDEWGYKNRLNITE